MVKKENVLPYGTFNIILKILILKVNNNKIFNFER